MRPAFASPWRAAIFCLGVLVAVSLPAALPFSAQPPRRELYSSASWTLGPFPWIERQIFEENEPIDVLFAGSSQLWAAVDAPAVQASLEERRGGRAVVRTLGWARAGFDALYFILEDLLRRRATKVLVIYDEHVDEGDDVHPAAHRWFRFADEPSAIAGLPDGNAAALYAASVLGMPRNLLSLFRPNGVVDPSPSSGNYWETAYHAVNPGDRLGALSARLAYGQEFGFEEFSPPSPPPPAVVYSPETASRFAFTAVPTPPYGRAFLERVARLASEHGVTLVFFHLPAITERENPMITERLCWPRELPGRVRLVGVPPKDFFAGLSEEDVRRLYFNPSHLNLNGQRYFTKAVLPAIFRVIDE